MEVSHSASVIRYLGFYELDLMRRLYLSFIKLMTSCIETLQ